MPTQASPGVVSQEIDLTFRVAAIGGYNGAMVGAFQWGPVEDPVQITGGEEELFTKFYSPNDDTAVSFLSAANFLLYANSLYVTRVVGPAARNSVPAGQTAVLVKNDDQYETLTLTGIKFLGRYAGTLLNGATISYSGATNYNTWQYKDEFGYAPVEADEFNLVLVDTTGSISGTAGTILERYELLSTTAGDKKYDGSSAYYKDVINNASNYILVGNVGATLDLVNGESLALTGGVSDNTKANLDYVTGFDLYANPEDYEVSFLVAGDADVVGIQQMIDIADSRKDCIAFFSPEISDVVNVADPLSNVVDMREVQVNKNTSYAFMDDNFKLVYDKYNDINRWIPCNSDSAGLTARTYIENEAWYSPAGYNRGQIKNVVRLAWNANKTQRDTLYKTAVNSIVSEPGEGRFLFGDKTQLTRPSAFDRINVRSLFIVIRKAISRAAKFQLFEFNDEITRSLFTKANEAYLETVQAKRGINDFRVKCDEENNTPQIIDNNEFVGSFFIKPARSINFITLNFIAVATGVDFEEVENVQ